MAQGDKSSNSMGDIHNNKGIITQGQTGNNTIINQAPREPNGIYQGNKKVGHAPPPVIDERTKTATFAQIGFTAFPDPTQPLEYGDLLLESDTTPRAPRPNMFATTVSIAIAGAFVCRIVGRRSAP